MKGFRTLAFALPFLLFACSEDEPVLLSGDIVGRLGYYEANYFNFVDSLAGVEVTLTDHEGGKQTTTTGADGRYIFTQVQAGVYTLEFDKANAAGTFIDYSREDRNALTHLGGGVTVTRDYYLLERPLYTVSGVSYAWDNNTVTLTASLGMVDGDRFNFLIYFANDASVSPENHLYVLNTAHSSDPIVTENGSGEKMLQVSVKLPEPQDYVVIFPYSVWSAEALGQPSGVINIPQ